MRKVLWGVIFLIFTFKVTAGEKFEHFKLTENFHKNNIYQRDAEGLSPMMSKVKGFLKKYGSQALDGILRDLLKYNHNFKLGKFNHPSMTWESGIGPSLGVRVHRRVDPISGSDKWQVNDMLTISVGAKTFLAKLRDEGSILIADEILELFAGVVFTRSYTYKHIATSYQNGIKKKFDKLLFGFFKFMWTNFIDIGPGEVISKSDEISVGVELAATTPSFYFLNGYGNATVAFSRLNTVSYHRPLDELSRGKDDFFRASRNVTKMVGTNVQVGLQLDFYRLLRITLLGMEYEINYAKDQVTHMNFSEYDLIQMRVNTHLKDAMLDLNQGANPEKLEALKPYITSREEGNRFSEELNTYALMWGKHIGSSTQKLKFQTEQGNYYFYRHNDEKANVKKSFWNFLFASRRLSRYSKRIVKNMTLEFAADNDEQNFSEVEVDDPGKVSFRVSRELQIKKQKKRYIDQAKDLVEEFKTVDGGIIQGMEDGELKAPLALDLHAQIGKAGIEYLMRQDGDTLRDNFTKICTGTYELTKKRLKRRHRRCISLLAKLYVKSLREYETGTKIHLKSFKNFLQYVTKKMKSFQHLKTLFGENNVYLFGNLEATTAQNMPFKTHITEGIYQGQGLISDFVTENR